ncbi:MULTISPECIES: LacI family DNA-binding transcriptional regulator [Kribbella]|uniref:LacI family transcriptional regulator n=2 Tax=Kribbella TaxID=182639 RepID=A0A4R0IEB6_9ACTN|nr:MULTISPECIES: LacI family DNA-binding transcriptional regulator [Kribbella]TCC15493.1 LacI family transcriptional regulator [Kribbella sindirgiensis]TCC22840.1 LacI family transcriptional regulator [Kribbella speibonae]TCC30290.1 LacI family transcriptional regulator [Kribbella speibonae]
MNPTLTDVAQRAGVSLSTASRAFSDPDRIGRDTLRRIIGAAEEIGYVASAGRRSRSGLPTRSATVAMIVPDIGNPVWASFVKAAQAHGWNRRQTVVLTDTDGSPDREREIIGELHERVDGFVVCSPRLPAHDIVELCGDTPLVLVNRTSDETSSVVPDAADGLRQALEYLRVLGHEHVAYAQGSPLSWSNQTRVEAIRQLADQADIELEVLGWQAETVAGGQAAAASVVASGATAVIAHNDLMALGIIAGAAALGVEVPGELSVIGIDDTPLAEVGRPTLTSIQVPMSRAGVMSIDMLHQQLTAEPGQTPAEPRAVTLPTQLVVRQSTGPVAGWTPARRERGDA